MNDEVRKLFDTKIIELNEKKDNSSSHLPAEKYRWIIRRLNELRGGNIKKEARDYRILKTYEVTCAPKDNTVVPKLQKKGTNLLYVSHDELFDVISEIHVATKHGARDVMHDRAKKRYANVTKEVLQLFADLCQDCQVKRSRFKRSNEMKTEASDAAHTRCQVDIINMQSRPDCDYHFILYYKDQTTKFVCLRPLCYNTTEEIADQLVGIFCTLGSPSVLQSTHGRDFASNVIKEVKVLWPECVLVHGKLQEIDGEERFEKICMDIQESLDDWMKKNESSKWSNGLRFIQWEKNNHEDSLTKTTPYFSVFHQHSRLGLKSSKLSNTKILDIKSEEDLDEALNAKPEPEIEEHKKLDLEEPSSTVHKLFNDTPSYADSAAEAAGILANFTNSTEEAIANISNVDYNVVSNEDLLSRSGIHFETTCSVCEFAYIGNIKCGICNKFCHENPPCSKEVDIGTEQKTVICLICKMKIKARLEEGNDMCTPNPIQKIIENPIKRYTAADVVRESVLVSLQDVNKREPGVFRNMKEAGNDDGSCCSSSKIAELRGLGIRNPFISPTSLLTRLDEAMSPEIGFRENIWKRPMVDDGPNHSCSCKKSR